jgi:hypothetical protein
MQEETIKKFKEYDFAADSRWQDHMKGIFPIPPLDKLTKMRKKWYQKNVDQQFDPEVDLDAATQPENNQYNVNHQQHTHGHYQQPPASLHSAIFGA